MKIVIALILAAAAAAACAQSDFAVRTVPVENRRAHVFAASHDGGRTPSLFVLDGWRLIWFDAAAPGTPRVLALPEGAGAVDIADLDGDGLSEVIAYIAGTVVALPLAGGEARELFTAGSSLRLSRMGPIPYVMAAMHQGVQAIALPTESSIQIRGLDGAILAEYSADTRDAAPRARFDQPFHAAPVWPLQAATGAGIEFRISRFSDLQPALPENLRGTGPEHGVGRPATPLQSREAGERPIDAWPWAPLTRAEHGRDRVMYAIAPPDFTTTDVAVQLTGANGEIQIMRPRRYPGVFTPAPAFGPDFNGDGFRDLFLWNAPLPGISLDSLARAAQSGTWPVTLTVHLFDPAKRLYEARPGDSLALELPIVWFFALENGAPMRALAFEDLDADGKSDLAMSTGPRKFAIWRYAAGFGSKPAAEFATPQRIEGLDIIPRAGVRGTAALVLRAERELYIVEYRPEP